MTDFLCGPGPDNETAFTAADRLIGGDGADTLTATAGGNALYGDAGDDVLNGAPGNDILTGGGSPEVKEHNVMHGYGGDDTIFSASSGDQIYGGAGDDTIVHSYSNVSSFQGGVLKGGAGTDEISFYGLPASGTGVMQLDGGLGTDDTLIWANGLGSFTGPLIIDVAAGLMKTFGTVFATFSGFEAIKIQTYSGAQGDITFTGGDEVDTLDLSATTSTLSTLGGTGNVQVRSGQTTLHGGLGDDVIQVDFNNAAAHNLFGDGGHDRMVSGGGQSTLSGG